jgi:tetratricopeptide (TPR) repeat protein
MSLGRPKSANDNVVLARRLCQQGLDALDREQWGEAEEAFRRAIDVCPSDHEARQHYADALWRRGAADQAIGAMTDAAELSGGDASLIVQLGRMHLARGSLPQAYHYADFAVQTDPRLSEAWALRGDVLSRQGETEAALRNYHRALSYDPGDTHAGLEVAQIYRQRGQWQLALSMLEHVAKQLEPGQEPQRLLYLQGLALKALRRHDEALEQLALAHHRGPPTPEILYHLAEAAWMAGDLATARRATQEARELGADERQTRALVARMEASQQGAQGTQRR